MTVNIDAAVPTVTATALPGPNLLGWNNSNVTVSLAASITGPSGIASITYSATGASADGPDDGAWRRHHAADRHD